MPLRRTDILLLAGEGASSNIVYQHLAKRFGPFPVVCEKPVAKSKMLKVRIHKIGLPRVVSQLAFMTLVRPVLAYTSRKRVAEICDQFKLDTSSIEPEVLTRVESVNSQEARDCISRFSPRVIIVNGTRIIGAKTLSSSAAQFINTHAGITPQYRGSHGGYWARYNNEPRLSGVTIHLVDQGIDTGDVLAQAGISPTPHDNFVTYPYLQLAAGLSALERCVAEALDHRLEGASSQGVSNVWYHPGIFQYIHGRLRGIK